MKFFETLKRRREKKYRVLYKSGPSTLAAIFAGMALALWAIFAILTTYPVGLYLYYTVVPKTTELLGQALSETSQIMVRQSRAVESDNVPAVTPSETVVEITRDKSLPEGHYLNIPQIGVDTVIWEAPDSEYESALRRGVWRVPDFSDPEWMMLSQGEAHRPIILAAHRFGYIDWTQDYRLKNSFYKLPDLDEGDEIEIVWDQRRYVYRVTKVEEGTEITDYSSDLILYTCKFLVSPIRIVVYAELVN